MALAIRFDRLIRERTVADQAPVTQPRMTQIMNLLNLAPEIQEQLPLLPPVTEGKDPITERELRPIVAESIWRRQRANWNSLRSKW